MYYATLTNDYEFTIEYLSSSTKISEEVIDQLSADLDNVLRLIGESKGKEKHKLEGVAEALDYAIELLK